MALTKIKNQVEYMLQVKPETRNNDKLLQVNILKDFYGVEFIEDILNPKVPSLESIRRCRQKFQSEGKYISSKFICNARKQQERIYREFAVTRD